MGSTDHTTTLDRTTYSQTGNTGNPGPGMYCRNFVLGIDCEAFGKSVVESGTDSSSRSLPIILEMARNVSVGNTTGGDGTTMGGDGSYNQESVVLRRASLEPEGYCYVDNPVPKFIQCDTFVCSDGWFFWNSDGTITPSV